VQKLHIKAARDSISVGSLYNINYVSQKQCNRYIMCNGTSCSALLKKQKPLFELDTGSSKHTIMHKKMRIITPQQAYTAGRMKVLTESLLESTLVKTRLNLTQKEANTVMHRKNEHHYRGMQHM
jgi:hypothetical protein